MGEDRRLDEQLARSTPTTSAHTLERDHAVRDLITKTRPRSVGRRRRALGVAVSVAALVGLGGAAVADSNWNSWWAPAAVHEYEYTVPSGGTCTGIIGNVDGLDSAAVAAAEDFLAREDLLELVDLESSRQLEQQPPAHLGEDYRVWSTMDTSVFVATLDHVRSLGLSVEDLSYEAEFYCPGFEGVSGG